VICHPERSEGSAVCGAPFKPSFGLSGVIPLVARAHPCPCGTAVLGCAAVESTRDLSPRAPRGIWSLGGPIQDLFWLEWGSSARCPGPPKLVWHSRPRLCSRRKHP